MHSGSEENSAPERAEILLEKRRVRVRDGDWCGAIGKANMKQRVDRRHGFLSLVFISLVQSRLSR